ncbi:hypothetical protein LACDD01_02081 [Lactococcus sp. DD01]|nr:hypothetical protein LACDD01_02081 [Lactococcus sp. DD01]
MEALQRERKTLKENYKEIVKELTLYENVKSLNDELQDFLNEYKARH